MRTGRRRLGATVGGLSAVVVVAAGAYSVAAVAERAMKDEAAEDALYRCEPVSTDPGPLSALFPDLGTIVSATWCAKAPGTPEYGRLSAPNPDDLQYYAVVRTAGTARLEASTSDPWLPGAGVDPARFPAALNAVLPSSGQWVRSGPVFIDRVSGTVVLFGADPNAKAPTASAPPPPSTPVLATSPPGP